MDKGDNASIMGWDGSYNLKGQARMMMMMMMVHIDEAGR
jgi:hypothetical protein